MSHRIDPLIRHRLARRPLVLVAGMLSLILVRPAHADPWDRFESEYTECTPPCTVCGVPYDCQGGTCTWGNLSYDELDYEQGETVRHQGIALYCVVGSGVALPTASATGQQIRSMSTVFRAMERPGPARTLSSMGASFELNHIGNDKGNIYGTTIPLSKTWLLSPITELDWQLGLLFGKGLEMYQYGFTTTPLYTWHILGHAEADLWRMVLSFEVPAHFVATDGEVLDWSASWLLGGGLLWGLSRRLSSGSIGMGMTVDARYSGAASSEVNGHLQVPLHLALRSAHDFGNWITFLVQPGVSMDLETGGDVGDTTRLSLLLGLELESWVLGYQGFFQGRSSAHSFGLSYIGRAGEMAAGKGVRESTGAEETTTPAPTPALPTAQPCPPCPAAQPCPPCPAAQPCPTCPSPAPEPAPPPALPPPQPSPDPGAVPLQQTPEALPSEPGAESVPDRVP